MELELMARAFGAHIGCMAEVEDSRNPHFGKNRGAIIEVSRHGIAIQSIDKQDIYEVTLMEAKLLLKELRWITNRDLLDIAMIIHPLAFQGTCKKGWVVKRDLNRPGSNLYDGIYEVSHPNNDFSFQFDTKVFGVAIYRQGDDESKGHDMHMDHVVDFLRAQGYRLPFMGYDLVKEDIAILKT